MTKARVEAFSDGVFAVIITIMVLELKPPDGDTFASLESLAPTFAAYVLSFLNIGIYWNNHHHFMHTAKHATPGLMWANLHLLFWLSLLPFLTAWVGEHYRAAWPTAVYGVALLASALAWLVLQRAIIRAGGGLLDAAIGRDVKGKLSPVLFALGIALAFVHPWISDVLYAVVTAMWIVPDRRVAAQLTAEARE
jgi:uncharacterized membrane protein